ncbi:MAG: hypothetical protein P8K80_06415 [Phycisphaerales bacterium]|nr:hypothetical protein [Phycisphaerales bacterium]
MHSFLKTFASLSILTFAVTADGQFNKPVSVSGLAPAQGAPADDASTSTASPEETLRALQNMNEATGDHLAATNQRITQMTGFLESKGMLEGFKATDDPPKMLPQAMSFQDALNVAIQHDAAMGPVESTTDPATVQREITAYTNMVRTTWNQYQQGMVTVQRMTDYMNTNGVFKEYLSWADDQKASQREEMVNSAHERAESDEKKAAEREAETQKDQKAAWATYNKHHQEMLNTAWQHYKFRDKMRLQYYKYSQEYSHGYWNNYGDSYGDVY